MWVLMCAPPNSATSPHVSQTPLFRFICLAFSIGQAGNRCQVSSISYCWAHVPTHIILFSLAKWESSCMLQNSWFQVTETQFKSKLIATEKLRDVSYFRWIQELKSCQPGLTLSLSPPSLPPFPWVFLSLLGSAFLHVSCILRPGFPKWNKTATNRSGHLFCLISTQRRVYLSQEFQQKS